MKKRMCISFFSILLSFCILTSRIFILVNNNEYRQAAAQQSSTVLNVAKVRGTIYDKDFQPLTNSQYSYKAAVMPCSQSADALYKNLPKSFHPQLKKKLSEMMPFSIDVPTDDLYAMGVDVFPVPIHNEENQTAVHIIGQCDNTMENGISGLEFCYDNLLKASGGFINATYQTDALRHSRSGEIPKIQNTVDNCKGGIVLTLDKNLQQIAEEASKDIEKGAVLIMDCQNGDILASVSRPLFDIHNPQNSLDDPNSPFINRTFLPFAVGSTFKLLTAATALEQGITTDRVYNCKGSITVDDNIFKCHHLAGHGWLNMEEALKKSCNPYFISLALEVGGQNLLYKAKKLGFGSSIELAPKMETGSGTLPSQSDLTSSKAIANFGFGQGALTATPIQIGCLVSAIANGGKAVTPRLVEGVTTDGKTFLSHTARYEPQTVFFPDAANTVKNLMISVVESGSGTKGKPQRFGAGGKTASAQSGQFVNNTEVVHAWFSGFYPAENPIYSIVVLYEGGDSGGDMACPVFKTICDNIGDYGFSSQQNTVSIK